MKVVTNMRSTQETAISSLPGKVVVVSEMKIDRGCSIDK